jgi:hypothetical protein
MTPSTRASSRWALQGESILAVVRARSMSAPLPRSLHRLPGPLLVVAERFADSPVGPFSVLSVGVPVRLGARPAWHYCISVVSTSDARRAGRSFWGFPHQLGTLTWATEGDTVSVRWEEQEMRIEAHRARRPLPFLLPVRSAQVRSDGPVIVPEWMRGMARRATVTIASSDSGPAAFLAGTHQGLRVSGLHVRRSPARVPAGMFSSLRAPLRSPEPGVAGMRRSAQSSDHPLPLN